MMKMTPDEFQEIKNKLQECADEGFAQGQSELAGEVIRCLEGVKMITVRGSTITVFDFNLFINKMISQLKTYQL